MYNRYIPGSVQYPPPTPPPNGFPDGHQPYGYTPPPPPEPPRGERGGIGGFLENILGRLNLDFDTGDILLILIIILLFVESGEDDWELLLVLGAMLFFGK